MRAKFNTFRIPRKCYFPANFAVLSINFFTWIVPNSILKEIKLRNYFKYDIYSYLFFVIDKGERLIVAISSSDDETNENNDAATWTNISGT